VLGLGHGTDEGKEQVELLLHGVALFDGYRIILSVHQGDFEVHGNETTHSVFAALRERAGANLSIVGQDKRDQERDDRDRERSDEAHWRVAEEGAEDKDDGPKKKTEKSQEDTRTADR
jgi:hypothetical protein